MERKATKKKTKKIPRKKKRAGMVHLEANVEEWPIFGLSKVTSEDRVYIRQTPNETQIVTVSTSHLGPLRPFDRRVYFALTAIWQRTRREDGQVNFSVYELLKMLGLEISGRSYEQVRTSIERLKWTPIKMERAFIEKDEHGKTYVSETWPEALINKFHFVNRAKEKGQLEFEEFNYIQLNPLILKNLLGYYTKKLDVDYACSLTDVAMFLYCYLDKRTGGEKGAAFQIGIKKLAEALNIRTKYPSDIKRVLDKAHRELIKTGYLKSAKHEPLKSEEGEQVKYIIRAAQKSQRDPGVTLTAKEIEQGQKIARQHLDRIGDMLAGRSEPEPEDDRTGLIDFGEKKKVNPAKAIDFR